MSGHLKIGMWVIVNVPDKPHLTSQGFILTGPPPPRRRRPVSGGHGRPRQLVPGRLADASRRTRPGLKSGELRRVGELASRDLMSL